MGTGDTDHRSNGSRLGWVSRSHGDTTRGDGRHTDHRSNGRENLEDTREKGQWPHATAHADPAPGGGDREDASSMVTAGATANTTEGNSRASRESGCCCVHIHTGNLLGVEEQIIDEGLSNNRDTSEGERPSAS